MFCKKSSRIKSGFCILSFSAIASFVSFANNQHINVETIAFPITLSDDKVETLPETDKTNPTSNQTKKGVSSLLNLSALDSGLSVGCTQAELTAAINDGNNAGTAVLQLPSNCTYTIENPATVNEAFPIITGNITIIGGEGSVITRAQTAAAFRIFTIAPGATLTLRHIIIENGNTTGLGGGILDNGTLVSDNVILSHNNAANGGAISVSSGATAQLLASTFLSNTTTGVGGGGIINSGELNVKNSYFSGNTAPINGGAINTQASGTTTIMLSLITYNISGGLGGALSNLGTLNVYQSIVNYNTGSSAGGIATGNTNVTISKTSNTAILNNQPDNCSPLNTIEGCLN